MLDAKEQWGGMTVILGQLPIVGKILTNYKLEFKEV